MLTRMLRMKPFSYTQHQPHFQTYRFIHLFGMYERATHKQTNKDTDVRYANLVDFCLSVDSLAPRF